MALALSVLLYCYALIMGTSDAALPWALKILMITLVTVAVVIYRKPFQHLFAAVGYGAIGATERSEADLSRAAAKARENTRAAATLTMPGFAAYRAARWARRNPAQAAGLALNAATAASTAGVAAGAAAGTEASGAEENAAAAQAGVTAGAGDATGSSAGAGATGRARAWGASAGTASASDAPPLRLPPSQGAPASWGTNGSSEPAAYAAGSAAPPLPPLARSAGASSGGQVRSAASAAGAAQRQSGSAAPARRPSPGGSGGSIPAGIPPSWSSRGQAPRRP
ncbi:MAG: hypothetical protein ACTHKL_31750, partial [Streptosporangiaceae bacterium]